MISTALSRAAALAAIVAIGLATSAPAQTTAADPHHPDVTPAQSARPGDAARQIQGAQPGQPGMMPPGMMGERMSQGQMQPGMSGVMPKMSMRGHMIKVIFAIADSDGDGALSFEEITTIHKRIFDKVDANKDGKVTAEEVQAFMRE